MDKYDLGELFDEVVDEWGDYIPLEEWPSETLVDLEILINGELQRRAS